MTVSAFTGLFSEALAQRMLQRGGVYVAFARSHGAELLAMTIMTLGHIADRRGSYPPALFGRSRHGAGRLRLPEGTVAAEIVEPSVE